MLTKCGSNLTALASKHTSLVQEETSALTRLTECRRTLLHHFQASSNSYFRLRTYLYDSRKPTIRGRVNERAVSFEVNAVSKPRDFDANDTGELFVVIDEDEMKDRLAETEHRYHNSTRVTRAASTLRNGEGSPSATANARQVQLYCKNLSDAVAIYTSPDQPFLPSAVSFLKQGRQELVLIADWLNDSVHVTRIENGEFRFVRYLDASRSGELVRPTALSAQTVMCGSDVKQGGY